MTVTAMSQSVCSESSPTRGRPVLQALLSVFALLFFASCGEGEMSTATDAGHAMVLDHCNGRCTEVELCVQDNESNHVCARICANQLRCWSGCCLPLGDTGYNVCRPTNYCYAE
jgi:hypothetical protein